jgi:plasmid stability protein
MANLTITVDEATLKKARIRALAEGTSVNEILRKVLDSYAGVNAEQIAALEDILEISRRAKSGHRGPRRWSREELYERK